MNTSNVRIDRLLSCFSSEVQNRLIDFCNRISNTSADVYILMARKASCFFYCLEELGLIQFNGYVTSERVLDMDTHWLEGKRIIIIDDAIVSGTSIYKSIKKLESANVASIRVHVLSVNQTWFQKEMLLDKNGNNLLEQNCNVEVNENCIALCFSIVKSILLQPRPYDIDFPLYKSLDIKASRFSYMLNREGWNWYDVSSVEQKKNNIFSITVIPRSYVLREFENEIHFSIFNRCLIKVRLYITYKDKAKKTYSVRVVPMIVFDRISIPEIEQLFYDIVSKSEPNSHYYDDFTSATSKLRFLQFFFSHKFACFWLRDIQELLSVKEEDLLFEDRNLGLIFPDDIDYYVKNICKKPLCLTKSYGSTSDYKPIKCEQDLERLSPITIESALLQPFIDKYYNKELKSRKYVLDYGKKAFEDPNYENTLKRLETGLTIQNLLDIISFANEYYNPFIKVSLFIDRAIDMGIIVPITQIDHNYVFRAFRHGEDVLFGKREEILYLSFLYGVAKRANKVNGLTHILTEKLIVIFTQIGLTEGKLEPYRSNFTLNPPDKNGEIYNILRIKTFLKGPVSLLGNVEFHSKTRDIPYITDEDKASWFTNELSQKKEITTNSNGLYIIQPPDTSSLTTDDIDYIDTMADMFGQVCNTELDTGVTFGDDELTKIATCLTRRDVIKAVAEELYLFKCNWEYSLFCNPQPLAGTKKAQRELLFEAINSAEMKIRAFSTGEARHLVESVMFHSVAEKTNWRRWFKNAYDEKKLDEKNDELNKKIYDIYNEGCRLVYSILIACHILRIIEFIDNKISTRNRKYRIFYDSKEKIIAYLSAFEKISVDSETTTNVRIGSLTSAIEAIIDYDNTVDLTGIVDKGIDRIHIEETKKFLDDIRNSTQTYLADVRGTIGTSGKIADIKNYNHVVAIVYYHRDIKEQTEIRTRVTNCYVRTCKSIQKQIAKGLDVSIEALPPNCYPSWELDREHTGFMWFVAQGSNAARSMTTFALNIFHHLTSKTDSYTYKDIHAKIIHFSDILHSNMIKKPDSEISAFIMEPFYRFIEQFPITYFQVNNIDKCSILAFTDKNRLKSNDFMNYINSNKKAVSSFKQKGKGKDIVLSDSEYVISEFEYNPSANNQPNKELKKRPDVLIMVATKDEEIAITSEKGWISRKTDDGYDYFEKKDGLTFALARSSSMGPDKAAQSAQYYYSKINPKYLAMAGFCAGRENKVNLGDVIVPYKMIKYGEGAQTSYNELDRDLTVFNLKSLWKQKAENFTSDWQKKIGINQPHSYKYQMYYFMKLFLEREGVVSTTDFQNNEDIPDYRDLIKQEVARGNVYFALPEIKLTKQGNQNYQEALFMDYQTENGLYHDPTPSIRVGIIATGQTVQKWDGIFDRLGKDYDRKIYALDMEATSVAGVGDFNDIDYIIAKGVGDFATGNKTFDNHYMKYAIRASYHFIVDFFNSL